MYMFDIVTFTLLLPISVEPRTPSPHQNVSNDRDCSKPDQTLDIKLVKFFRLVVGKTRNRASVITHSRSLLQN